MTLLLSHLSAQAQPINGSVLTEFSYANNQLLGVSFEPPTNAPDKKIAVLRDNANNNPDDSNNYYNNPVWLFGGMSDGKTPVGYISGCTARVSARFIKCEKAFWVRAIGTDGFNLPPQQLVAVPNAPGTYVYPVTDLEKEFTAGVVQFYDPFELKWQLAASENATDWVDVGTSKNRLYVTHGEPIIDPIPDVPQTKKLNSSFYIGCKAAKGKSTPNDIVAAIFEEFKKQEGEPTPIVQNANGQTMSYWKYNTGCVSVSMLYTVTDGSCGTWAYCLNDIIRLQGIEGSELSTVLWGDGHTTAETESIYLADANAAFNTEVAIIPGSMNNLTAYFTVKNWNFANWESEIPASKFSIFKPYAEQEPSQEIQNNGNTFTYDNLLGIEGQSNPDPQCVFTNHSLVKYNGQYYDPSYGGVYPNAVAWANANIAALGIGIFIQLPSGDTHDLFWAKQISELATQITITP